MILPRVDRYCAYTSGEWTAAIKEKLDGLCLVIRARYSPFGLNTVDQVWPENFGGLYKAPAVDLGRSVSMGVQADDE